jgi:SAM-dependent methyltransferase
MKVRGKLKTAATKEKGAHRETACPICCGKKCTPCYRIVLHNGVAEPIYKCADCSHKFVAKLPSPQEVATWYQGMSYFHQNCEHQGISSLEPGSQWAGFVNSRLAVLERYVTRPFQLQGKLSICEVGCLEGALLNELSVRGHSVLGLEVNQEVAEAGRSVFGVDIRSFNVETEKPTRQAAFDVAMAFHVFEHLRDPAAALRTVSTLLRPGGAVLLEVPCDDDEMSNPDHFHFFTPQSLERLMESECVAVKLHENRYRRADKILLGSLYAVGRRPGATNPHQKSPWVSTIRPADEHGCLKRPTGT